MDRKEFLEAAEKHIYGQRTNSYGTPEDSFEVISDMWSVYMGINFDPLDAAAMLILAKCARLRYIDDTLKQNNDDSEALAALQDNLTAIAGYAACGAEVATEHMYPKSSRKAKDDDDD